MHISEYQLTREATIVLMVSASCVQYEREIYCYEFKEFLRLVAPWNLYIATKVATKKTDKGSESPKMNSTASLDK